MTTPKNLKNSHLVVKSAVHSSPTAALPFTREDTHVGSAEGSVTEGVTDGVDCAVYVAQKIEKVPHALWEYICRGERLDENQNIVR